jgi:hypothetical protein
MNGLDPALAGLFQGLLGKCLKRAGITAAQTQAQFQGRDRENYSNMLENSPTRKIMEHVGAIEGHCDEISARCLQLNDDLMDGIMSSVDLTGSCVGSKSAPRNSDHEKEGWNHVMSKIQKCRACKEVLADVPDIIVRYKK